MSILNTMKLFRTEKKINVLSVTTRFIVGSRRSRRLSCCIGNRKGEGEERGGEGEERGGGGKGRGGKGRGGKGRGKRGGGEKGRGRGGLGGKHFFLSCHYCL